jgi:ankyrin repeat protein
VTGAKLTTRARLVAGLAAALMIATPVMAQSGSPGHQFLEAIRKRDGAEVDKALGPTGSTTVINTQDITTGDTALHIVTQRRDADWLRFLLVRGADANKANAKDERPLGIAVNLGWLEGVQALIERGARVDDPGAAGETALIAAVHRRDIELVRLLLKSGASPTRADNSGRSAKDYAALMGADSAIATEIANAAKTAAAKKPSYGPSF